MQFEIVSYDSNGADEQTEHRRFVSDAAAKAYCGRLAKRRGGAVDLARAGAAEWSDRYITTANPSEFHASGFRFERLT